MGQPKKRPETVKPQLQKQETMVNTSQSTQRKETAIAPSMAIIRDIIDKHHERLMRIFVYYCSFGEPLNSNSLKSTKFIKLLRDSKLLAPKNP